jgi:hypothetical protein
MRDSIPITGHGSQRAGTRAVRKTMSLFQSAVVMIYFMLLFGHARQQVALLQPDSVFLTDHDRARTKVGVP